MVTRTCQRCLAAALAAVLAVPGLALAQAAGRQQPPAQGQVRGPRGQRPAVPPIGRGMNAFQLQQHLDAFALTQAEQQLKLGEEQYAAFAPRLIKLQSVRRGVMQQRRRLLNELNQLLQAEAPRDEAINEKVRALDDVNRRGAEELVKSYQELDSVLTPWQRGRFRLFEEQLERKKVELLARLGPPVK